MYGVQSESSKQRLSASSVNLLRRMASTKKSGFIGKKNVLLFPAVETKSVTEKKRRKSDLVLMWITFWDVILYVATEIWLTLQGVLEAGKLFFNSEEVWKIREWLEEHLSQVPGDFSQSWRDGVLFCQLLNKLQPGCYPDANKLNTNFGVRNFTKAFRILEIRFDIKPKVTVEEIVTCSKDSESKLISLLLQLKQKTDENNNNNEVKLAIEEKENVQENNTNETKNCIAKGTGLMVGFVGRAASFGVFFSSLSDLSLVLEIRGPSKTICSERITNRSPKKKKVINPWKPLSPHAVIRSSSNEDCKTSIIDISQDLPAETEKCFIPLEYEIHSSHINFTYFPRIQGKHRIAILSQGLHISDSPYLVTVEPAVRGPKIESMVHIKSVLKPPERQKSDEEEPKKTSVRFQEPGERKERLGKILKREVLRYIVKIDGKDVVVDTDCIDNLATSLLKMDYELQKRPLVRRNSWGFVGDAERKISVIRQFGIDIGELEAQSVKMHRSHSLSLSPITKNPVKKSTSYECEDIVQQTILETVTEERVSHFNYISESYKDEDNVFALMNDRIHQLKNEKIEEETYEMKDFDLQSSGDKISEKALYDNNVKELDYSSSKAQVQMILKSENTNTKNLVSSVGGFESNLASISECVSGLDIYMDEEFITENSGTKTETGSFDNNGDLLIEKLSSSHYGETAMGEKHKENSLIEMDKIITDVEHNIEDFKDLEIANNGFIEEIPCTKTDVKSVRKCAQSNMLRLLDTTKPDFHKHKKTNLLNKKVNPHGNHDLFSKIIETKNSPKNYQCKCFQKTNISEGNLNCFLENQSSINKQIEPINISSPKTKYKSFAYLNINKNKIRGQRSYKYYHLGQKLQGIYPPYHTKKHRSFSKSLLENLIMKELQNIIKKFNSENLSSKNRTVSDPMYNSFNKNEGQEDLENNRDEYTRQESKFENNERTSQYKSIYNLPETSGNGSHQSNMCSKFQVNQNEREIRFRPVSSEAEIQTQNIPENFNIYHNQENDNISKKHSTVSKPFLAASIASTSNYSCESFSKSSRESISTKDSISKNMCQFTYKHFNPSFQNDRESPIKKQIELWETSTIQRNDKPLAKCMDKLHVLPELVDIKAKLKFWENVYHPSEYEETEDKSISKNSSNICKKDERNNTTNISSDKNLGENIEKQSQDPSDYGSKEETNINNSKSSEKFVDSKVLNMDSTPAKKRSFSDPGVLDKPDNEMEDHTLQFEYRNETVYSASSKDELSSSNDGNFIELFADDEESSMELLCSTEDEYIDDEISENISSYWGDISLMKGLEAYDSSEYEEFLQLMNSESLQSCAEECKFFGIATYFGHVAVKNRFWVLTKGAGRGNLSASVQGIGQHNVTFVSVEYTRKDIYEVTYQVFTPGLYLISVRWVDVPIPGSPYLCKVTF